MNPKIEAHNLVDLEGQSLVQAVQKDFGINIESPEKVEQGFASQVFRATLSGEVVYIRINKKARIYEAEVLAYPLLEQHGVPVPKVLFYKEKPETIGQPTIILSAAEGRAVSATEISQEQKLILYKDLGKLAHEINKIKLPGYGHLIASPEGLKGQYSSWREQLESRREYFERGINFCLEKEIITLEQADKLKEVFQELSSLDIGQGSFLHYDLSGAHFFTDGQKITGLIDLGDIMSGDPRLEIAVSLIFQNPTTQESFKAGYGELANDPMVNKYLLIKCIDKIYFRMKTRGLSDDKALLEIFYKGLEKL
jgi:aminoglycoside phosphotransferase (APT) family kinase protein